MFIVDGRLYGNRGIDCSKPTIEVPAIEKGMDWMVKHFERVTPETKTEREYPQCTKLYAIERIGVAGQIEILRQDRLVQGRHRRTCSRSRRTAGVSAAG